MNKAHYRSPGQTNGSAHHPPIHMAYYGTAQMQGNTRARVARGSLAFCPRVTRDLLSSHSRFALESLAIIIFISTLMLPINHLL